MSPRPSIARAIRRAWPVVLIMALFQAGAGDDPKVERVGRRLLVFGIDGATWDVIDPLLEQGRLPNLARLIREGVRAPLSTLNPSVSARLWTTIATGVDGEAHGIVDFVVTDDATGESRLAESSMRRAAAVWEILSERGHSVGVVNWWATYPAEEISGFVLSERMNRLQAETLARLFELSEGVEVEDHQSLCHPTALCRDLAKMMEIPSEIAPELLERIAKLPPEMVSDLQSQPTFSRESKLSVLKFSLLQDEAVAATGLFAARAVQPDVLLFYVNGLDGVEHHFWKYWEPSKFEGIPAKELRIFGPVIPNYYAYFDELLGRALALYREQQRTVIVVSDHGHRANLGHGDDVDGYAKFASGGHGGSDKGILVLSGTDITPGARISRASILDVAPTMLVLMGAPVGEEMKGRVLSEALDPGFRKRFDTGARVVYRRNPVSPEEGGPSEGDKLLLEKLRSLGYIK